MKNLSWPTYLRNIFSPGTFVLIGFVCGHALAEGSHRGINMDVNRTGYHMLVVIGDKVSMMNDITAEECANAATVLKQHTTDAWVCCYHTPDQAKGC